jgi:hypothetical protein
MQNLMKYLSANFDFKNNPNAIFIAPAVAFLITGIYHEETVFVALSVVFFALSGTNYTKPNT